MDSMDIDSPPQAGSLTSPDDRILVNLAAIGVPEVYLRNLQSGLVDFVRGNECWVPQLLYAILPSDDEVAELQQRSKGGSKKGTGVLTVKERLRASVVWLMWLMFRDDPTSALDDLSEKNRGERGVCGAVWGNNDIAYRCRTCEQDPTCAICVPCFENGDHKDHDYSTIYTGGGCCDCGDITAWKREGFCSRHKGPDRIRPLPPEVAKSAQPVLDVLFSGWRDKLIVAESFIRNERKTINDSVEGTQVANELTFIVVEMLLEFCQHSESLLSFVAIRLFSCDGLLNILVRSDRILNELVAKKLHELLLKFLAEPSFKYEFAKAFLSYYPAVINETVKESKDEASNDSAAMSTFSVQIFTVPTLTPRLVKEMNLLAMLFGCLREIFVSSAGEDSRLQVSKWQGLYDTTIRVVEDIRFVMSHAVVPKYILCNQQDIVRTWVKLLTFVQGMNPLKRETGIPNEEETENEHLPFGLCFSTSSIHSLLVSGAFSEAHTEATTDLSLLNTHQTNSDDADSLRHAKVGRLSQDSSAYGVTGTNNISSCSHKALVDDSNSDMRLRVPAHVLWLIHECLRATENWLLTENWSLADNTFGDPSVVSSENNRPLSSGRSFAFMKLWKIGGGSFLLGRHSSFDAQQVQQSGPEDGDVSMASEDAKDSEGGVNLAPGDENRTFSAPTLSSDNGAAVGDDHAPESEALHLLSLSEWPGITYDVSSQDVSVHIPLHRLLSLLLQRALTRCCEESTISIPWHPSASSFDFFAHILGQCHPLGFSAFTMEHLLRIRVFVAQVHAGMWKKNGEAALLSCEWYRSVRWSEQGLELDLFMLQCCAALAPPDLYVMRILERFGLSNYLSLNVEGESEYEPVLLQEMLTLLIQIVKERRFCGLTTSEGLKRELVYKLATGDATRSQLLKALPRDLSKFSRLQEVLDTVASYSNPSGYNQGMYSLRWPYWKELDLYHPRRNSRDLQSAEERYARFCSVSASTAQLPRWNPVYAPLSRIAGVATCKTTLQIIRAILFYAVLHDKPCESRAPDTVLIPALHLLSLSLDICFQLRKSNDLSSYVGESFPILAFACEEVTDGLAYGFGEMSLLSLLVLLKKLHKRNAEGLTDAGSYDLSPLIEGLLKKFAELDSSCMMRLQQLAPELVNHISQSDLHTGMGGSESRSDSENRKAKARQRQAAIMEKMRAEQSKFLAGINSSDEPLSTAEEVPESVTTTDTEKSSEDVCSLCHDSTSETPLSFLIHLQKSRLASIVDRGHLSWASVRQPNSDHINNMDIEDSNRCEPASLMSITESTPHSRMSQLIQKAVHNFASYGQLGEVKRFLEFVKSEFPSIKDIHLPCLPDERKSGNECNFETLEQDMFLCIKKNIDANPQHLDLVGKADFSAEKNDFGERIDAENILLVKYFACLSREKAENPSASEKVGDEESVEVSGENILAFDGFGPVDCDGIYLSSCGHAVHQGCLENYLSSLRERYIRRMIFEVGHVVDLDQGEFLCPLCRRLANSALPAVPSASGMAWDQTLSSKLISQCPSSVGSDITHLHLPRALLLLQSMVDMVNDGKILQALSMQSNTRLKSRLEPFLGVLSKMYFSNKQEKLSGSARTSCSIIMWDTLRYSIISTEIAARSGRTSLRPNVSLRNLFKEFKTYSRFIPSLFIKIVQTTRTENALDVLQRLRGIKLFADSVCSGISSYYPSNCDEQEGNLFWIFKDTEKKLSYVDSQFWKWAAEPVLAHDPFSSLMWVLFCLPCPVLSCEDFFVSLVHLFYAVSVAQVIATYSWKSGYTLDESDFRDSLIGDIFKMMSQSRHPDKYFLSNHMDSSLGIRNAIQRFTFPFLRRCLILWKLVNSSAPTPFSGLDSPFCIKDSMYEPTAVPELSEVQELEKTFKIPSVDIVIKDENIRHLVQQWFGHFSKEFELKRLNWVIHCTPATPFKLMDLPHLYQDLLQWCIKQRCLDCKSVLEEPLLCLLCGRLCSPSWKHCCRKNECQGHAKACGSGIGVFLLIRRTTILLQRSGRHASWPTPYLDAFGEEDFELHRGKPLYLNEERYATLNHMVASHGFDRSSKVLRQTNFGVFMM